MRDILSCYELFNNFFHDEKVSVYDIDEGSFFLANNQGFLYQLIKQNKKEKTVTITSIYRNIGEKTYEEEIMVRLEKK